MTYALTYRRVTEKNQTPMEVTTFEHLSVSEVHEKLVDVLPVACWVYVEDEELRFPGKGPPGPPVEPGGSARPSAAVAKAKARALEPV